MLNFRKANFDDIPVLLDIEEQCFSKDVQFTERTYLSLFRNSENIIDLIIYDGNVVGVVAVAVRKFSGNFFPSKDFSSGERNLSIENLSIARLCNLAILPQSQGKGFAKQTLHHYLNQLFNFNHIFLEVDMNNKKAIQLYEKCGFQHYKTIKNYYGENKHALKMKKVG